MDNNKLHNALNKMLFLMREYNININEIMNYKFIVYNLLVTTRINSLHELMNDLNLKEPINDKYNDYIMLEESYKTIKYALIDNHLYETNMKYLNKIYNLLVKLILNKI